MKISTKGRYALRLMVDLALEGQEAGLTLPRWVVTRWGRFIFYCK